MKLNHNGQVYDVDLENITLAETILLKVATGLTLGDIVTGTEKGDGIAFVAILFLGMRRNREAVKWQDLMEVNVVQLIASAYEDFLENDEATPDDSPEVTKGKEADLKGGTTPKKSSSQTSSN